MTALEMRQAQLKYQIEESPFSEEFEILSENGNIKIKGIFDISVQTSADRNNTQNVPRIIVFSAPVYVPQKTVIAVRGKKYKINRHEDNPDIGVILWLL